MIEGNFGARSHKSPSNRKDEEKSMNLNEEIEKHGGEMNFEEILKMHGM